MNDRKPPSLDKGRRRFIEQMATLGVLAAACPPQALAAMRAAAPPAGQAEWLQRDPWLTLAAVQEHLFPAGEDTPGAGDIRAIHYLHDTLENPAADGGDREFIVNGVGWLNELLEERYGKPFAALDEAQREEGLRRIEQSAAGSNWLSLLLDYLLEALLADPVYGGNPDGIGWHWLQHQPGFPRPPADKAWYRLAPRVHYRRKA